MKLLAPKQVVFVPDGTDAAAAFARTTHLGIGAHQDDLEIMAIDGILKCYGRNDAWFSGVVVSDGAGAPRSGPFADFTNEQMVETRVEEQKRAADIGEYAGQVLLLYPSDELKNGKDARVTEDTVSILRATRPEVVYTHNLMDKHDAHVAVTLRTIAAIRELPEVERPAKVYGCEVWRDLDWMVDKDKVVFDTSAEGALQTRLLQVFESQVAGGKRYDLATMGRRRANATYLEPHQVDESTSAVFAVDLTPLANDDALSIDAFVAGFLDRFRDDVIERLGRLQR